MNNYLYILIFILIFSNILIIIFFRFYIVIKYIKKTNITKYLINYQNLKIKINILEYQLKTQHKDLMHINAEKEKLYIINKEIEQEITIYKTKNKLINEQLIEITKYFHENKNNNKKYKNDIINMKEILSNKNNIIENLKEKITNYQIEHENNNKKLEIIKIEKNQINKQLIKFQNENIILNDKYYIIKKEIKDIQNKSRLEFEKIANQIIENKTKKFHQNNQYSLQIVLNPLKENLENLKKKIEETYNKESKERFCLDNRINELIKHTNKISSEANNLASALKNQNQIQGNWGELILETILENSGLKKDVNYKIQTSFQNTKGELLRPDVLIYLPKNRIIIIDSKVSLTNYNNFYSENNENKKKEHLQKHLKSINQHIDQLSKKEYNTLKYSLNFIIMFIPIEPAYLIAYEFNKNLWNYAYKKKILLVSPTNLITSLKIISDLWIQDLQSKNAYAIVDRAEKMYEKFIRFTDNLLELGKNLEKVDKNYKDVLNQLSNSRGNLINQANKLKNLGLKSNKTISSELYNFHAKSHQNDL